MTTQAKNPACENLVRKLTTGASLDDAEKSHLALCEGCLTRAVRALDEAAARAAHSLNGTNGTPTPPRPEAKQALEQGRRVFEREFGIALSKE